MVPSYVIKKQHTKKSVGKSMKWWTHPKNFANNKKKLKKLIIEMLVKLGFISLK